MGLKLRYRGGIYTYKREFIKVNSSDSVSAHKALGFTVDSMKWNNNIIPVFYYNAFKRFKIFNSRKPILHFSKCHLMLKESKQTP